MKFEKHHKELQEMFPELKDSTPAEEWKTNSYGDGGSHVHTIWEGPGRHTLTVFNDWCVNHPDTSIQKVKRYQYKEWRFKGLEKERKFKNE